jgi:hypothetical protein
MAGCTSKAARCGPSGSFQMGNARRDLRPVIAGQEEVASLKRSPIWRVRRPDVADPMLGP